MHAWRGAVGAAIAATLAWGCTPGEQAAKTGPRVVLNTSMGRIVVELDTARAPLTAENFLAYVNDGLYDGVLFHRVIPGFMIQGGGYDVGVRPREPGRPPIRNESRGGLANRRGTIAMARTADPHSARAQFFINLVDNPGLDFGGQGAGSWGYAVFGRVVEGRDVVDAIGRVKTRPAPGVSEALPVEPVVIDSARVLRE